MVFTDRTDAGRRLAEVLVTMHLQAPLLFGLPRGGVVVADAVASALGTRFEAFVALKVGAPGQEELGVGAVAEGLEDPVVSDVAAQVGISESELRVLAEDRRKEVDRRVRLYRGGRALPEVKGAEVVIIDDGLATGVTAEAALRSIRQKGPARLVLAVPVGAPDTVARLRSVADDVVCAESPGNLQAVGMWYEDFSPTTDEQVLGILARRYPTTGSMP